MIKERFFKNKIQYGWGGSSGGGSSYYSYYHPKEVLEHIQKDFMKQVQNEFSNYDKQIESVLEKLINEINKSKVDLKKAINEAEYQIKLKTLDLGKYNSKTELNEKNRKWLDEILKEFNEIIEI